MNKEHGLHKDPLLRMQIQDTRSWILMMDALNRPLIDGLDKTGQSQTQGFSLKNLYPTLHPFFCLRSFCPQFVAAQKKFVWPQTINWPNIRVLSQFPRSDWGEVSVQDQACPVGTSSSANSLTTTDLPPCLLVLLSCSFSSSLRLSDLRTVSFSHLRLACSVTIRDLFPFLRLEAIWKPDSVIHHTQLGSVGRLPWQDEQGGDDSWSSPSSLATRSGYREWKRLRQLNCKIRFRSLVSLVSDESNPIYDRLPIRHRSTASPATLGISDMHT